MKSIELKVEGMVCKGCENRVKNALELMEDINEVEASFVNGKVIVKSNENVDIIKIKEKIEDLGFEVKE